MGSTDNLPGIKFPGGIEAKEISDAVGSDERQNKQQIRKLWEVRDLYNINICAERMDSR